MTKMSVGDYRFSVFKTVKTLLVLLNVSLLINLSESRQHLNLVNNGYNGLVIGISEHVSQDHCNKVIHGIRVSKN